MSKDRDQYRGVENLGRFDERQYYPSPEILFRKLEEHPYREEVLRYLRARKAPVEAVLHWPDRRGAVLSDLGIIQHMLAGNVVIEPFTAEQLSTDSYDVTLGGLFFRHREKSARNAQRRLYWPSTLRKREPRGLGVLPDRDEIRPPPLLPITVYNPLDRESVKYVWEGPHAAINAKEFEKDHGITLEGVRRSDKLIVIYGHEMVLGHTQEFIGGRNVVTTKISGRSTTGRNFLEVCSDAMDGTIGYINRWTLEITNKVEDMAIPLIVGEAYAQIKFYESRPAAKVYGVSNGTYQTSQSIEEIKAGWKPEMMLPVMKRLRKK